MYTYEYFFPEIIRLIFVIRYECLSLTCAKKLLALGSWENKTMYS